jgi:hypothetical protein
MYLFSIKEYKVTWLSGTFNHLRIATCSVDFKLINKNLVAFDG